jgi:hypothetical protein
MPINAVPIETADRIEGKHALAVNLPALTPPAS